MDVRTALYRHFAEDGALLYVGITKNPMARLSTHSVLSPWFAEIVRIDIEWMPSLSAALDAETEAIHREAPIHNRHVPPRKRNDPLPAPEVPPFNDHFIGCIMVGDPKERRRLEAEMVAAGVRQDRIFPDIRVALKVAQREGQRLFVAGTRSLGGALDVLRARKVRVLGVREVTPGDDPSEVVADFERARAALYARRVRAKSKNGGDDV